MKVKLNEQQAAFVYSEINGAKRCLAGPGSGKTHALSHRVSYMIEQGVIPENILCVTFSKMMAEELISRITKVSEKASAATICTIHALCYRILKEEGDQRLVAADKNAFKITKYAREVLDIYGISEIGFKDFLNYVGGAKSHAIRHNKLESNYKHKIEQNGGIKGDVSWKKDAAKLLAGAHIEFDGKLKEDNLLTFDDMLCEVEWLFEDNPGILRKYQQRFQYVLVDEAQDTSKQAMRILVSLANNGNFTVIGDSDQTIYEFNGADPEDNLWQGFETRFPNNETYKLEINYRSSEKIIKFINTAISENYNEDNLIYRKYIKPRDNAPEGFDITYNIYNDADEEAKNVIANIETDIWETSRVPGDYYICSRTRAQLPYLYRYLFSAKIPFVDITGGSFWDLSHIQDIIAYLKLSINKMDDTSFIRVYNKASIRMKQPFDLYDKSRKLLRARGAYVNHRWLGKAFLEACGGSWGGIYDSEAYGNYRFRDGISDLQSFMSELDHIQSVNDKIVYVIENSIRKWYLTEDGGTDGGSFDSAKADDFATIKDIANDFQSTAEFLQYVDDITSRIRDTKNSKSEDVVILSTIHRLKGLERPIVCVLGFMENLIPHRAIMGMKSDGVLPFRSKTSVESERRLFFVAASRPEEELRLTGAWNYQGNKLQKSRFAYETGLAEAIAQSYIDTLGIDSASDE